MNMSQECTPTHIDIYFRTYVVPINEDKEKRKLIESKSSDKVYLKYYIDATILNRRKF